MFKNGRIFRTYSSNLILIAIASFAFVLGWQGDFEGGDIAASRRSFIGESPIDIWGSFSGFFYGSIPNRPISWGLYLYIFQIFSALFALTRLRKSETFEHSRLARISFYTFSYVFLCFSTTLTRDSTMACCIFLGLSVIPQTTKSQNIEIIQKILATILIAIGISFRPWLVLISVLIFIFLVNINDKKRLFSILILASLSLPIIFNLSVYSFTNLKKVHPEMQVMIMDAGSLACLSSYDLSRKNATKFLNDINGNNYSNYEICSNYRLNTWTALGTFKPSLRELNLRSQPETNYTDNRTPLIFISTNMSQKKYEQIRNSWVKLLADNYKDYTRIKFLELNQLLLLGDSSQLRVLSIFKHLNSISLKSLATAIFFIPWDLLIYCHLLAPLLIIFIFSFSIILFMKDRTIKDILCNKKIIFSYSFMITYLIFSTFAYIGDTGRYMYLPSLIFWYYITISFKDAKTHEK
jgi:hypothetical protein